MPSWGHGEYTTFSYRTKEFDTFTTQNENITNQLNSNFQDTLFLIDFEEEMN